MRITVDRKRCQGHALCSMSDPDTFPLDDLGYSALEPTDVVKADEARVRHIVSACPERALLVSES
ncbi:ferredoxin [Streptomyces sp. bgisy034]|uniref:ferredoxin n=1 Tax=Streptomyces sp. bgisy034 TaxID=3413774 RepID=UPI003EB9D288